MLSPGVEMPAQKIVTSVTRNKVQLIDLIVASLTEDPILSKSCLILTGSQETPYKIQDGKVELCHELRTLHEEADVVIINQLIWAVRDENPATNVLVKCDDTDVFVRIVSTLLLQAKPYLLPYDARRAQSKVESLLILA